MVGVMTERKYKIKKCALCPNRFKTTDSRAMYCFRCANIVRQSKRKIIEKVCFNCGATFTVYSSNTQAKYCSEYCSDYVARRRQNGNVYRYKRNVHYAEFINFDSDTIIYDKVFNDNGCVCHLCGEPIDMSLRFPHSMSATIDHVVPLSKGGTHTYDNIRPAHLSCNSRKGNDLGEDRGRVAS